MRGDTSLKEGTDSSGMLGELCTLNRTSEANQPDIGNPRITVDQLFNKDNYNVLETQYCRKKDGGCSFHQGRRTPLSTLDMDDKEKLMAKRLYAFALGNRIDINIANEAVCKFGSIHEASNWMVDHCLNFSGHHQCVEIDDKTQSMTDTPSKNFQKHTEESHKEDNGCWICQCSLMNRNSSRYCLACDSPSPIAKTKIEYEEKLSYLKLECIKSMENLQELNKRLYKENKLLKYQTKNLMFPAYWDPFPPQLSCVDIELVGATGALADERKRVLNLFKLGGVRVNKLVSIKRLQNSILWYRYAAQRTMIASKVSNRGNPNVKYVFHGPKTNTASILKNGFISQLGVSKPYGIWTHKYSSYPAKSFADHDPPHGGGQRIFICQAAIGTPGKDNGSGRCPGEVIDGVLADCHQQGDAFVFYTDSQIYPEYLIQWQ